MILMLVVGSVLLNWCQARMFAREHCILSPVSCLIMSMGNQLLYVKIKWQMLKICNKKHMYWKSLTGRTASMQRLTVMVWDSSSSKLVCTAWNRVALQQEHVSIHSTGESDGSMLRNYLHWMKATPRVLDKSLEEERRKENVDLQHHTFISYRSDLRHSAHRVYSAI